MNPKRGFFRIWLLATVLWAVTIFVIQLNHEQSLPPLPPGFRLDGGTLDPKFWLWKVAALPFAVFGAGYAVLSVFRAFSRLFRLWLVASILWVGTCLWQIDYSCFFGSFPWCDWWVVRPLLSSTYVQVLAITFGVPAGILALGWATRWVVAGFRMRKPLN